MLLVKHLLLTLLPWTSKHCRWSGITSHSERSQDWYVKLRSAIKCVHESWRWTLRVSANCLFCSNHDGLFVSRYKIWCVFRSVDTAWTSEMTTWSPKKFNNFVTIKNNTMMLSSFMWLWMSNNSERLLRKWQKTVGDTFFAAHCRLHPTPSTYLSLM